VATTVCRAVARTTFKRRASVMTLIPSCQRARGLLDSHADRCGRRARRRAPVLRGGKREASTAPLRMTPFEFVAPHVAAAEQGDAHDDSRESSGRRPTDDVVLSENGVCPVRRRTCRKLLNPTRQQSTFIICGATWKRSRLGNTAPLPTSLGERSPGKYVFSAAETRPRSARRREAPAASRRLEPVAGGNRRA
jgi:hypothetical protein